MPSYKNAIKKSEEIKVQEAVNEPEVEIMPTAEDFGMDREKAIQRIGKKDKYKNKHFAWVDREQASMSHNRWEYLKIINDGTDVEVVKSRDEADRTTGNVLCWRDRKYQDIVDAQIRERNIQSINRYRQLESSSGQADNINQQLQQISGASGIRASPLKDTD